MRRAWREADELGVDSIFTWDHFFPLNGDADGQHFEGITSLAALAQVIERAQVGALAEAVQEVTGESVELAYVDQGYTGEEPFDAAADRGIILEVVKLPEAKRGFVLLPRRWVVERSFGWMARFRRLARDYERLSETLEGLHYVAFSFLMLHKAAPQFCWSS